MVVEEENMMGKGLDGSVDRCREAVKQVNGM